MKESGYFQRIVGSRAEIHEAGNNGLSVDFDGLSLPQQLSYRAADQTDQFILRTAFLGYSVF
jgi:hypothetical protein